LIGKGVVVFMAFPALGLAPAILRALLEEGYEKPTPIQAQAIGPVMEGKDLLGCAQTGTGKTAAFALPILHRLSSAPVDKSRRGAAIPRVLVLAPTRELANQIGESFATYGRHTGLTHTCVYGGVSQMRQVKALQRGVDVLVATPGRLIDLMEQRLVNLSGVNIFVLDEADRMLDMGFIQPIRRIASALPTTPARQTLLFSATMPREIMHLADSLLKNPIKIAVSHVASAAPLIEQSLYMVPRMKKALLLRILLRDESMSRVVVFTKTKHGADKLCKHLVTAGVSAVAIHGNKAQNQRDRALDAFRIGRTRILVATDVAARGLDVDAVSHVINYDLPVEPEAYVHRIGRTGRAGATGQAISFCGEDERDQLRRIERITNKRLEITPLPPVPEDLLTFAEESSVREPRPAPHSSHPGRPGGSRSAGYAARSSEHAPRQPHSPRAEHHTRAAPGEAGSTTAAPRAGHRGEGSGRTSQASKAHRGAGGPPAGFGKKRMKRRY